LDYLNQSDGTRITLTAGDYIHFHAEQCHGVVNGTSEESWVLVIRSHFQEGGSRTRISKAVTQACLFLKNKINRSGKIKDPAKLLEFKKIRDETMGSLIVPWTKHIATPPSDKILNPHKVMDTVGLGKFLCEYAADSGYTIRDLVDRAKRIGFERAHNAFFSKLHHGESSSLSYEDLSTLASIYDVMTVLLCSFIFPSVDKCVTVRRSGRPEDHDLAKISSQEFRDLPEGVVYEIPCRKLAFSDVSIAFVSLDPGGSTIESRHPGTEFLLVLKGEVEVKIKRAPESRTVKRYCFLHFSSRVAHTVANTGDIEAEVLIVRFGPG
jgi:quercetin dioxygenase-like cupin family protein